MTVAITLACAVLGLLGCSVLRSVPPERHASADPSLNSEKGESRRRVIILCTGNSCRSQMAEAFWRRHGGDQWEVTSAGTKPSGKVYPPAVQVMAEVGIDIGHQTSKSVEPLLGQTFDLVITVCSDAEQSCPSFPGGLKHIHHGFDDPPAAPGTDEDRLTVCRRVRNEIEQKVKEWIEAFATQT